MTSSSAFSQAHNILFIGMPVADILVEGMNAEVVQTLGMSYNDRTVMDAHQLREVEKFACQYKTNIVAGGSLANSACAIKALCPDTNITFVAACADDTYGQVFADAVKAAHVVLLPHHTYGTETSRSYICTDTRGERAIGRYFGDSMSAFAASDIEDDIKNADIVILEGELLALDEGYSLWEDLIALAKKHSTDVGFTLFGAEQVTQHRTKMIDTIKHDAGLLFGNDDELYALMQSGKEEFETACQQVHTWMMQHHDMPYVIISQGEHPAILVNHTGSYRAAPQPVDTVVSTLGAGDAYMAGVCAGLIRGDNEEAALNLGHKVAGKVLQQSSGQLSPNALQTL